MGRESDSIIVRLRHGGAPPRDWERLARDAADALEQNLADYRALMEDTAEAILLTDERGLCLEANEAACELTGYAREEWPSLNFAEMLEPAESGALPPAALPAGPGVRLIRGKDGERRRVDVVEHVLAGGRRQHVLRDLTERGRAEEEIERTLSLLSATLESTADGILVVGLGGKVASYNRKFAAMWQIPDQLLDTRDDDRLLGCVLDQLEDPRAFLDKVHELYGQPAAESFDILAFKNGRIFERYSLPQRVGGTIVGRVWSFRDVTDRRRAEQALRESEGQLRQSQKMEAVGRLAGGVAHDFNNLLTAILGHSQLLLDALKTDDPRRQRAEEIQHAAERAAQLTRQLLAFSRKQVMEVRPVRLDQLVDQMLPMLGPLIGEHIELRVIRAEGLGTVRADPSQLEHVLLNLVVNARDAMLDGGRLTIETANVTRDQADASAGQGLDPGEYVMLAVSDTGSGMTEEVRVRVFEPFFTTKPKGMGTGLGLAMVYGISQQSGGGVWVESTAGSGSTFRMLLPRVNAAVESVVSAPIPGESGRGTETVLLVEDEAGVRALAREGLLAQGYRVLEAAGPEVALRMAIDHRGPIHLMVTDVVMPKMSGRELAKRMASIRPETGTLYISGYTDAAILRHGVLEAGTAFLHKPFTLEALAAKVRSLIDQRSLMRSL